MTHTVKIILIALVVTIVGVLSFFFVKAWQQVKIRREAFKTFDALGGNMKNVVEAFAANIKAHAQDKEAGNVHPKLN